MDSLQIQPKPFRVLIADNSSDQRIWECIERELNDKDFSKPSKHEPMVKVVSQIIPQRVPVDIDAIKAEMAKGDVGCIVMPADTSTALVNENNREIPVFISLRNQDSDIAIVSVAKDEAARKEVQQIQNSYGPLRWGNAMEVITEKGLKPLRPDAPLGEAIGRYNYRATVKAAVSSYVHRKDMVPKKEEDAVEGLKNLGMDFLQPDNSPMSAEALQKFLYLNQEARAKQTAAKEASKKQEPDPKEAVVNQLNNLSQGAVRWGMVWNEQDQQVYVSRGKVANPGGFVFKLAEALDVSPEAIMPKYSRKGAGIIAIPCDILPPSKAGCLNALRNDVAIADMLKPVGVRLTPGA